MLEDVLPLAKMLLAKRSKRKDGIGMLEGAFVPSLVLLVDQVVLQVDHDHLQKMFLKQIFILLSIIVVQCRLKTSQINSGVNEFIDEQKKIEGRVNLNITEFGTTVVHRYSGPIKNYNKRYRVSINGMTALYQAIGEAIDKAEQSTEEAKIVNFVIVTDGLENASRGYYRFLTNLQERIQEAQNKGWIFTFLAEGQNIMEQGWKAGIETGTCTVVTEKYYCSGH